MWDKATELPFLWGDMRRMQQVLVNLMKNAIKFTEGGEIKIEYCYILS